MRLAAENEPTCDSHTLSLSKSAARIGKLGLIYVLGRIAPLLIGMFLLPVFTHYLVPAQMGIVSLATQVTAPMAILVQLGLWPALKRHYFRVEESLRPNLVRTVLVGQTVQTLLLCGLLSVAGLWLADVLLPNLPLGRGYVFGLWLMIVWACFFAALVQLASGLMQLEERAGKSVGITFLAYVLRAGLGVAVVVGLGWQGFGRQGASFAAHAITASVALWVVWRCGTGGFDFSLFRRMLFSGLTFLPHSLSGMLALAVNGWLLNRLVSPAALGVYGVAIVFAQLIQIPLPVLGTAAYPTQAKLMRDGSQKAKTQQSRLYTFMIVGIAGWALAVWLFAPIAITILTAPQYHEATQIVPILVLAWLLYGLYIVVAQPVSYHGGGFWLSTVTGSSILVSVGLGLALIPRFGAQGAAWAMAGCFATRLVVCLFVGHYLCRLPWEVTKILRALACVGLPALADLWLLAEVPLVWAIVLKATLLLAMLPAIWALGVVSTAEVRRAKEMILQKLRRVVGQEAF